MFSTFILSLLMCIDEQIKDKDADSDIIAERVSEKIASNPLLAAFFLPAALIIVALVLLF